ncbi:MAG: M3 family metallopeptidase [Gammaproteobacteria bacterium]|nr:M3 family metallopeptidase [Gammaproteobacteria bacterium]
MRNPLLQPAGLPAFKRIRPEHAEPAIDELLRRNRSALARLLAANTSYTWGNLIGPLEECQDELHRAWSPIGHLHAVADSEELRKAYNACLPKLTDYETELSQNEDLHGAYRQIAGGPEYGRLDTAQRKAVDNSLRDFRLSGIELPPEKRARFREIQQSLSRLQTRFEENLLDATQAWTRHVRDPALLEGLPQSALELAAQAARQRQTDGWLFTLEYPSYLPVMQYAESEPLRREMYDAYTTRASEQGPAAGNFDNSDVMVEILNLRRESASLLGYGSYAELSLARKMARSPEAVLEFMHDLVLRSRRVAQAEFAELAEFAGTRHGRSQLNAWDVAFYSEKLRRQKFDISDEDLRPYFPLPVVLDGLFEVVHRLYGVSVRERHGVERWHEDVRFFEITDEAGALRGLFYLDPYIRRGKRSGAWMDDCIVRRRTSSRTQLPVAYLVCNFPPPVEDRPALLSHDEVMTLFHEFGHGLHHMLTLVDYADVSGINGVPWDAVELPSQFMENWCWERESLDLIARHYRSGERLPEPLYRKMQAARHFQSGMQMLRQLELALFDFRLHHEGRGATAADIQALLDEVRRDTAVIIPPPYNRFQNSFSHIFAGGYAAGYYSYKWAEVLSADAFSKFEETGIFDARCGRLFLHSVLEQGGSRDPMDLFIEFRGREPSIEALLRHSGIVPVSHEN